MSNRVIRNAAALCVLAGTTVSMAGGLAGTGTGLAGLQAQFPGARVNTVDDRVISIYGKPMTGGATPAAAAAAWLKQHGDAFGVGVLDLREQWSCEIGQGASTVFAYQQYVGGLPVELSVGRVLVRNGGGNHVVYAAGQLSRLPEGGFAPMTVTADQAMAGVRAMPAYANMERWGEPALVAYDGRSDGLAMPLTRAWKFRGDTNIGQPGRLGYSFFVDAATGGLLFVRNEIMNIDVSGKVTGKATPGVKPDENGNAPVEVPLVEIKATVQGGNSAFSDADGNYTIANGGGGQVTVNTGLASGRWVKVTNNGGAALTLSDMVTPPGPADFLFNPSPAETTTAQVNAFLCQTRTHDYFKSRAPGFNGLDTALTANANLASTCNAYYDGSSTNFYHSGGGCVNTAYSTVASHEYGHHIVNRLGLAQDAFGEGYGDTTSVLIYDVGIVGQDFFGLGGGDIRNIDAANKQYPCSGEIHDCGQVVAGVWRDTALRFKTTFGSDLGLALAQQLEVDWSLITVGGVGGQSASPTTAIEAVTADDDDGDIDNGSPDYADLKAAYKKHNIDVPPIKLLAFTYPDGLPDQLAPGKETPFHVNVSGISEQPQPGTGQLSFRLGNGNFTTVSMTVVGQNQYLATLPAADCLENVDYYVQAKTDTGKTAFDPQGAPTEFRSAIAATTIFDDAFEVNSGWVGGAQGDTATTGKWNRMDPEGTAAQPGDDHTPTGTMCWVTDGRAGQNLGDFDVDGGKTTLVSPTFDFSTIGDVNISYWRWYSNNTGDSPNADTFRVDISDDGGNSWKNAETVGPISPAAAWIFHEFRLGQFVSPTSTVKLRFIAEDAGNPSLVEAAVDDFRYLGLTCASGCYADFDGNGTLNLFDFLAFLNDFNAGGAGSDCDGNGVHDLFDFLCFVNLFNAGC